MTTLPTSYLESRARFRERLPLIQSAWPDARLEAYPISSPDGDLDLTIDVIRADSQADNQRLLVFTTAQHGIEGYVGSAVLEMFIDEYLPRLNPKTTGLLLVHAINPWGMKHWQRNNPAGVDLNRNFYEGDFSSLADVNADYPRLAAYLSPARTIGPVWLEKLRFVSDTLCALVNFGARRVREAALMGQYCKAEGIYHGGLELQPEAQTMMKLYASAFARYGQIVHLDMHTGYGPRWLMTLVTSIHEQRSSVEITADYNAPRVAASNPDEFYSKHGDMIDWEYAWMQQNRPEARFFAATCEFGTFGESILAGARSLRITILKNRLNRWGANPASRDWVNHEYRELYLPSEPAWLEKALADARQTCEGVLSREGYF